MAESIMRQSRSTCIFYSISIDFKSLNVIFRVMQVSRCVDCVGPLELNMKSYRTTTTRNVSVFQKTNGLYGDEIKVSQVEDDDDDVLIAQTFASVWLLCASSKGRPRITRDFVRPARHKRNRRNTKKMSMDGKKNWHNRMISIARKINDNGDNNGRREYFSRYAMSSRACVYVCVSTRFYQITRHFPVEEGIENARKCDVRVDEISNHHDIFSSHKQVPTL